MGSLEVPGAGRKLSQRRYSQGWRANEQDKVQHTRVARARKQNFSEIRNDCLKKGILWEDPDFPAANSSIYFSYDCGDQFEWKRPGVCIHPCETPQSIFSVFFFF